MKTQHCKQEIKSVTKDVDQKPNVSLAVLPPAKYPKKYRN